MIIRNAELNWGRSAADIRIDERRISAIGDRLGVCDRPGDLDVNQEIIDAQGCAVVPGLHDHHIHLMALGASLNSVSCGPPSLENEHQLLEALTTAAAEKRLAVATPTSEGQDDRNLWVRGGGYHESVAGRLDRHRLDKMVSDLPLRIQHRSGVMWFLNTAALEILGVDGRNPSCPAGLELDSQGFASGRLMRADTWLRDRLGSGSVPNIERVGRLLASYGVTGCTDASASNAEAEMKILSDAQNKGALPQHLLVMGTAELRPIAGDQIRKGVHVPSIELGCVKILLDDVALPPLEELVLRIDLAHRSGRNVAIHCVTRVQVTLALAAWNLSDQSLMVPGMGDRIEHAAVCPPEAAAQIAKLGLSVVTQPNFIRERGDDYLSNVEATDQPWLWRCGDLIDASISVGGGTDAPYGSADPWLAMQSAVTRLTTSGRSLGKQERISPQRALELFTTNALAPGGVPRTIADGQTADLCVLDRPWAQAARDLSKVAVIATVRAGRLVYRK